MADYDLMTGVKKAYEAYSPTNKPTAADIQNVVSPVSSGGIIERGSNANGEYVKFADGTMICQNKESVDTIRTFTSFGVLFWAEHIPLTYAAAFLSPPALSVNSATNASVYLIYSAGQSNETAANYTVLSATGGDLRTRMSYIAVGRWK